MKVYERLVEHISSVLLIVVGILGVSVTLLDFIGVDFDNGPWKWVKGPLPIILLTVAILALALGVERLVRFQQISRKIDNIERLVLAYPEEIIRSLNGVSVRSFVDIEEFFEYSSKRISEAKKTVDDLSWGSGVPSTNSTQTQLFEKYIKTMHIACKRGVRYREVMSFSTPRHIERADYLFAQNFMSYNLKYYNFDREGVPPLVEFMLIDSEEVMISSYRWPYLPSENEMRLSIKHPQIVSLFRDYFDSIWHGAKPLKIGNDINNMAFNELRNRWGAV